MGGARIITSYVGLVIAIIGILIGIIGGAIYGINVAKEKTYTDTDCTVEEITWDEYSCKSGKSYRTCYNTIWVVGYLTESNQNITSYIDGYEVYYSVFSALQGGANEAPIGTVRACWYDTTAEADVQWEKPDPFAGMVTMIVGFSITIVAGIVASIAFGSGTSCLKALCGGLSR